LKLYIIQDVKGYKYWAHHMNKRGTNIMNFATCINAFEYIPIFLICENVYINTWHSVNKFLVFMFSHLNMVKTDITSPATRGKKIKFTFLVAFTFRWPIGIAIIVCST
jgi:hypothetical protein